MEPNMLEIIGDFMESALVRWVQLFEEMLQTDYGVTLYSQYMEVNSVSQRDRYLKLTDGIFLNEVMRVIDPNPKVEHLYDSSRGEDQMHRVQNFSILNRHIRAFYQENLQHLILMPLPNVAILGQDSLTEAAVEELRRLLLLILGCAVQCENKERFIQQIQSLDIETQAGIASCIQEVTQDPHMVLPLQWEELAEAGGSDLMTVFSSMTKHIQNLLAQKDSYLERIAELCRERETQVNSSAAPLGGHCEEQPESLALQLADSKAKLRRLKQQLEDKGDQILDYNQEIQTMDEQLKKLQKENRGLQSEVRGMRSLRDELDCLRERASRAELLTTELQSCKNKLRSQDITRTQLKEQQQLCAALQETKALLEEQLSDARARCSSIRELEKENLLLRHKIMDVEAERDTERQRVDELLEMNMSLEADLRQSSDRVAAPVTEAHRELHQSEEEEEEEDELSDMIDHKPLSVEVGEASTLRLLGAEQENAELRRRLEQLQTQQEADLSDAKDELETEHQKTVKEFQNLKNENGTLKQQLEELVTKLQHLEAEKKKLPQEAQKIKKAKQEVQGLGSFRGEGVGQGRFIECAREIIGRQRQSGVGEEYLISRKVEDGEMQTKTRGEAEGGQQDKEETEQNTAIIDSQMLTEEENTVLNQIACSLSCPELEQLTQKLQEAQDEAERQTNAAQDLRSKLGEQSRKTWEAEQRLVLLEAELQRLKKAAESLGEARRQIEVLQSESLVMEEELCRLRSQVELQRMQTTVIATLEGERAALERDRENLRNTMDNLRTNQRKCDQLELTIQSLRLELDRHGRSLDTCRRREEELEAELREVAVETESLTRARDQALTEALRLEQEKEATQSELDGLRKDARQRDREVTRLRHQLESTTLALENSHQRVRAVDTEHRRVCQQLSETQQLCTCLQDSEKQLNARLNHSEVEHQRIHEEYTRAQAQISTLSQDLTKEQTHSQKLTSEGEHLNKKLQNTEAGLKLANESLHQSQQRIEALSSNIKTLERLLESEKKKSAEELSCLDSANKTEVSGPQSEEMTAAEQSLKSVKSHEAEDPTRHLRESLAELEKEKAVLVAGQEALSTRLSQSQESYEHLKEQLEALRRHSLGLQDSCTSLQALNTQLQVEQASLSSQHAAALAQCSEAKALCAALEAESKVWAREREESHARAEALRRDHDRLTALQQRQEVELEELLEKHSQLRSNYRSLEGQNRELEARYQELLQGKTHLEEREREMEVLRAGMEAEAQSRTDRQRELERLKEDNERLQAQQREWLASQAELLAQGSVLRGEQNTAQLERTRLEGELSSLREAHQSLDISHARLTSQFQLLTQLKGNMEEENRHLAEQNQGLLKENRSLLEQSLERRDQHYSQQREYQEKLSELRREKQKLVEKIMDQYRVLEPSMQPPSSKAKKSNWIADRMKKLIKPKGGGGGREGRALFTAAGSVENLADTEFTSDTVTQSVSDPRSAPVSPSPLRKAPSQTEPDISVPGTPALRSASGGRRKLGSRHGWGLGLSRGGSMSQSFSPGDNKTPPRHRLGSSPRASGVVWEGEKGTPPKSDSPLSSQDSVDHDEEKEE